MKSFQKNLLKTSLLATAFAFVLSGCKVFSLYPLYQPDDLIYDESLLGKWQNPEDDGWFVFSALEPKTYRMDWMGIVEYDGAKDTARISFKARMLELDGKRYLDLFPIENEEQDFYMSNLLPVHSFMKIELSGNDLVLREINSSRLKRLFEQNRVRLKHELVRENGLEPDKKSNGTDSELYVLITASTEDLQKFIVKYANDPEAFDESIELKRK